MREKSTVPVVGGSPQQPDHTLASSATDQYRDAPLGPEERLGCAIRRQALLEGFKQGHPQVTNKEICGNGRFDQSQFYRWKRGEHVGRGFLRKLGSVMGIDPDEID